MKAPKICARRTAALLCLLAVHTLFRTEDSVANDGFTEPHRTVQIATPETGIIGQMLVEEGASVHQGDPLVQLDVEVQEAMLAIAAVAKDAQGRVNASQAEVALREHTLRALESLQATGHARKQELERARADLAIAEGQLTAAHEEQRLKEMEYERIRIQIERRTVRAPFDGVVTKLLKHAGEFTAPNDPHLLVLVQLDPLYATFDVDSQDALGVAEGDTALVHFKSDDRNVEAIVEFVSPVIDAESGTVAIKVRIPNPQGDLKSGQACSLLMK